VQVALQRLRSNCSKDLNVGARRRKKPPGKKQSLKN